MINNNEIIIETRGRKPQFNNDPIAENVELFIAWVEGRYIPATESEEAELYAYGERAYPYLMELQYNK